MTIRRPSLALLLALLSACGPPPTETLARRLITAVIDGDKVAYADCYVQKGDMTADGSAALVVEPGGRAPDDEWLAEIQAAFTTDRAKIDLLRKQHGTVAFGGVLNAADAEQTPARQIRSIQAIVQCKDIRYVAELGRSAEASRGRVLQGPPGVSIRKE
jgi:hypothetical protein